MKKVKKIISILLSAIYPNKCICCDEILNEKSFLCEHCKANIERNDLDNICTDCGLEKNDCVCKYNIYRFNSLICVFKNIGLARNAYYKYKFAKNQFYASFFADEICKAVNKCYNEFKIDLVCGVPSFYKLRYDHSGYIAKEIAKKLNVPFDAKLLKCVKRAKRQHKSDFKERIFNVDEKYIFTHKLNNANVLLIDDIKTTGATIDECTKILLYSGAKNVYCVTALGTVEKTKIEN